MAKPRYRYAHQQERKRLEPLVAAGEAYCVEPICVMPTRWIAPGTPWDVCHDPTGSTTTGPGHARCNRREGAARGNRMRGRRGRRVAERPSRLNRWVL